MTFSVTSTFIFLKAYIFENLLIFQCLILEIYCKDNQKKFTKCCLPLWFYNVIKTVGKRGKNDQFLMKEQKKNKTLLP